ncbi:hypothetical protein [Nocardia gipuzkoensis]|uniref:hypothetical protein n=1 Tax=Nocardia gipuzkoensis TaxID=2749991 RepID=UPI00237D548B|nr:hypothetical protein [Nocardia gipuzkoensis]MDE1675298.1 hypothetical protein [Nocardia gipuzkoensis]
MTAASLSSFANVASMAIHAGVVWRELSPNADNARVCAETIEAAVREQGGASVRPRLWIGFRSIR